MVEELNDKVEQIRQKMRELQEAIESAKYLRYKQLREQFPEQPPIIWLLPFPDWIELEKSFQMEKLLKERR